MINLWSEDRHRDCIEDENMVFTQKMWLLFHEKAKTLT